MAMPDAVESNQTKKRISARSILLLLVVLSSPLCCFDIWLLPSPLKIFEVTILVENRLGETLYITPISTTTGQPDIIRQRSFRQRDFPLKPNSSIALTYDAADNPLEGIVVCSADDDCRFLVYEYGNLYLDSFESLPRMEPGWLVMIQSYHQYSFDIFVLLLLGLVPVVLFFSWLYLVVQLRFSHASRFNDK